MNNERIRRVAQRAAESLRKQGWTQRKMYDAYSGASCLTGAVNKNCGCLVDRGELYTRILEQIHPGSREYVHHQNEIEREIIRWNDDPERRVEDVLAVLEAI